MSLLLDALKPTEPECGIGLEPEASELQEEPLDGAATLALLSSKATAQTTLSLVPNSSFATSSPAGSEHLDPNPVESSVLGTDLLEPDRAAASALAPAGLEVPAPEPVFEIARVVPNLERASPAPAGRKAEAAPSLKPTAAPANTRAPISATTAKAPRTKTYALACAALAAVAGIGIFGKSMWWPGTNAILYPAVVEVRQAPPVDVEAATPSTAAVQVSSARPADQFADSGYAPEIDLRNAEQPASGKAPWNATVRTNAAMPENAAPPTGATPPLRARGLRGTAARASIATLSVTRSEGPSPIDRHVQAGYQALGLGDATKAQTEYVAALALDPNNVDALMGVATVAVRGGNSKAAAAAYAQVLRLEPGNPDATAAMATLGAIGSPSAGGSNDGNDESRLKILIAGGDGGRPALHAALAGVYAADSRWSEAAQEYFSALAKDPGNPDLAFNVAASLDQNRNLGMALAYYGQALLFARQRPTQIDLRAVEQRMSQLQAHVARAAAAPETP